MNKLRVSFICHTISSDLNIYRTRTHVREGVLKKCSSTSCQLSKTNVGFRGFRLFHSENRKMASREKETFLIAGLGNLDLPGTRHSVGMQLVDRLKDFLDVKLTKNRECFGLVGNKELRYLHIVLLKPKLPMNVNGKSVHKTARHYNVPTDNIFMVHDELEKAVGKSTLKEGGSAGGHNGVKSVIKSFSTEKIKRIRIGIDRPASIDRVPEYVLKKFDSMEAPLIDKAINQAILKLAQHLATRTGLQRSEVFSIDSTLESETS